MRPWPYRTDSYHRPAGVAPPPPHPPPADHVPPPPPPPKATPTGRSGPTPSRSRSNAAALRYATNTSRMSEFEVLDSSRLQVSSSSEDEDLRPSRPSRPRHGRSLSNPFPSLFSNKKKPGRHPAGLSDSDSSDEAPTMTKPKSRIQTHTHRRNMPSSGNRAPSSGNKDFATGHCMTCGSLVRWPRELHVFRCTICMTINDLQPLPPDERREHPSTDKAAADDGSGVPLGRPGRPGQNTDPISVDTTRRLITQCLRDFLQRSLVGSVSLGDNSDVEPAPDVFGPTTSPPGFGQASNPFDEEKPPAHLQLPSSRRTTSNHRSYSTSYSDKRPGVKGIVSEAAPSRETYNASVAQHQNKRIFKGLDDYLISSFTSFQSLNTSFLVDHPSLHAQSTNEHPTRRPSQKRKESASPDYPVAELDAKTLLCGDLGEISAWYTGGQEEYKPTKVPSQNSVNTPSYVNQKTPRLDWTALDKWYEMVIKCAETWRDVYEELVNVEPVPTTEVSLKAIELQILSAQEHTQRNLRKATESILKRPGRPITRPSELRFLLIILANPLLHEPGSGGSHSGIMKRILGLLSNSSAECHNHLIPWFARYPPDRFIALKDLVARFLNYRLLRQQDKLPEFKVDVTAGLIPSESAGRSPATLHAALGPSAGSTKKPKDAPKKQYQDDWQIRAAAQVMGLVFAANTVDSSRKWNLNLIASSAPSSLHSGTQLLATSEFYVSLLDQSDLFADFEAWEHKRGKFSFCQYPFLLSIASKRAILNYDSRRQMESKARDAFFDSIISRRAIEQFLVVTARRHCLVEDSLRAISEVSGTEDIKKGLRIVFKGEEGFDAGGLRKEWFLLLVRELFNPDYGLFVQREDSQYCYFNPNSFEDSEKYSLIGVVFGLAIYNDTILDAALPSFVFRKLLAAAPALSATSPPSQQPRPTGHYTLEDVAQYDPGLARGLRAMLQDDYDPGEVDESYFVINVERYGSFRTEELCPGGKERRLTKANRREFVTLYTRYLLDTAVARQFEPFKRGFFKVCGGNALSLFRPEEIELLVRGSPELDVPSLKAVAEYTGWPSKDPATEQVIQWFWEIFEEASADNQRQLLFFVTGSDRIPVGGATSLKILIQYRVEEPTWLPSAQTCFNKILLPRYEDRAAMEAKLWTAVRESGGFLLK